MIDNAFLEKVRLVTNSFQKTDRIFSIPESVKILGCVIDANLFVINRKGQVMGSYLGTGPLCDRLYEIANKNGVFPEHYSNAFLFKGEKSQVNVSSPAECVLVESGRPPCSLKKVVVTTIPLISTGDKAGTLLLHRSGEPFGTDEVTLAEMGAALITMMIKWQIVQQEQAESRNKSMATIAFESLSYSEVEAIEEIFSSFKGSEGIVVASRIADELGITRSVIVNALRKFESAGIIESRSLGMKGTYIKIKNPEALQEVANYSPRVKKAFM